MTQTISNELKSEYRGILYKVPFIIHMHIRAQSHGGLIDHALVWLSITEMTVTNAIFLVGS